MSRSAQIEDAAALWLLRRDDQAWTPDAEAQLTAWLDAAPEHKVAFWRLEQNWDRANRLAALRGGLGPASAAAAPRRPRPVVRRALAVGLGLAAAACIALATSSLLLQRSTYVTQIGDQRAVPLADGSHVDLDTQTQMRATVNHYGREVWLDRGQAYFEVAHDPSRPFVVHAGNQTVTVLGTKFMVRRTHGQFEVAVVEGRVRVDTSISRKAAPSLTVTGGDVVVAQESSALVVTQATAKVTADLAWRHGFLTFDRSTLAEAVEEFNRYNPRQMVIADPAISAMQIGGSFEARNADAFMRLLQQAYGLKIEADGETAKISR